MKLIIPLTGTVLVEKAFNNGLSGDPNDPIRPVDIDLGNVSLETLDVDLDNEVMIVEVTPADSWSEPTGELDGEGEPTYKPRRKATQQEKMGFLQHARDLIEGHTKDELYAMSKSPKLKRPFKEKK